MRPLIHVHALLLLSLLAATSAGATERASEATLAIFDRRVAGLE